MGDTTYYQRVKVTLNAGPKLRREKLEGRACVVAPAAMLARGVINGSQGPLFYDDPDMVESIPTWNYRPLIVNHPPVGPDGTAPLACSEEILNTRKVGVTLNAAHDDKLRSECWFDIERTKEVDARVMDRLEKGLPLECSTGLVVHVQQATGEFGGVPYVGIARRYKPDHLAVLPDELGAYSVAAGGGILAMNAAKDQPESVRAVYERSLKRLLHGAGLGWQTLTLNELSFNAVTAKLFDLLRARFGQPGRYWEGCFVDRYEDRVVFEDGSGNLFTLGYSVGKDDVVSLDDAEPAQVSRVVQYKAVSGGVSYAANSAGLLVPYEEVALMAFDKKAHVAELVAAGVGKEDFLNRQSDEVLEGLTPPKPAAPPVQNTGGDPPTPAATPPVVAPAVTNNTPTPPKWQEVLNSADPATRDFITEGIEAGRREKAALVANIKAKPGNQFTDQWLDAQPLAVLRPMAALGVDPNAQPAVTGNANFLLASGVNPPVLNSNQADPQDTLELPSLDFGAAVGRGEAVGVH